MKLLRLHLQDFRGIRAASIEFGPGLTVLHGPNELGKSSIVEAIHAAFFLQSTSQSGNDHVTWGGSSPACVTLTFEHGAKLWRVSKRFGGRRHAALECSESVDSPKFREVLAGRGVEGRLRQLLAWGIAPPGGQGGAPKAESFLLTALIGRQGEVQRIFDTSLNDDRDDTGKSLVTQAMGALDKDPLVSHILERLGTRVDAVFTSQGNLKVAADSPLVKLQQHLRTQRDRLEELQEDESKGRLIQADVVRLQDERQRLSGMLKLAEADREAAKAQAERASARTKLRDEIDDLERQRSKADRLTAELTSLESRLLNGKSNLIALKDAENIAAAALEATRQQLQAAAEAAARETEAGEQSGRVEEAAQAQRRAELERLKTTAEARLKDVTAAEQAASDVADLEREFAEVSALAVSAAEAVVFAERALDHATVRANLDVLSERHEAVTRAAGQLAAAQQREQVARDQLQVAAAAVADAEGRRDRREYELSSDEIQQAESELLLLQSVEAHILMAALRVEVRALEETAARARALRPSAQTRRLDASGIDQRAATRVLPTREQIAAWRTLEEELKVSPPTSTVASAPLTPVVLASLGALVGVAAAARVGLDWPLFSAVLAGLVAAGIAGGLVWVRLRGRVRPASPEDEQRARGSARWTQEVEPSLRAAGLTTLADYESAVADLERQKVDARLLREQADQEDRDAGEAERRAAPVESRREALARLEREATTTGDAGVAARAEVFGGCIDNVRLRIAEVQQTLEATRGRLSGEAGAAVRLAIEQRSARQAEYDAAARLVTAAETTLAHERQQSEPETAAKLLARLGEIGEVAAPAATAAEASRTLEDARTQQTTASTKADGLRARLDKLRPAVARRVDDLGGDLGIAREQAQRSLDQIATELAAGRAANNDSKSTVGLEGARIRLEALTQQVASNRTKLDSVTKSRSDAEAALTALKTEAAALRGQLTVIDRPTLDSRLQQATGDPVFQISDGPPLDLAAAKATVEDLRQQLERCTNDLNHARGQLHLIAGHVGSERLAQQEEHVSLAHAEVLERERTERAALRLLREIERVEAERATHLGRALAKPITEAFRTLTGGRYGALSVAPDLKTEHIEACGETRLLEHVSFGTREQLATLLRLAIAGYLQTAIVLDDQLVHSDSGRLAWFGERLRLSSRERNHQVIVFTCRPGDYLRGDASEEGVTEIDLATLVSRLV